MQQVQAGARALELLFADPGSTRIARGSRIARSGFLTPKRLGLLGGFFFFFQKLTFKVQYWTFCVLGLPGLLGLL